jgi:hypothetical protein
MIFFLLSLHFVLRFLKEKLGLPLHQYRQDDGEKVVLYFLRKDLLANSS